MSTIFIPTKEIYSPLRQTARKDTPLLGVIEMDHIDNYQFNELYKTTTSSMNYIDNYQFNELHRQLLISVKVKTRMIFFQILGFSLFFFSFLGGLGCLKSLSHS